MSLIIIIIIIYSAQACIILTPPGISFSKTIDQLSYLSSFSEYKTLAENYKNINRLKTAQLYFQSA